MSKKEQGGIVLQKKHIVIGIIAAVVIIVTAVLAGMKLSRSQQQDTFTPDLEQGTSAWSGDQLPDKSADSGEAVGIKIPGYPSISLPANQQTVQVALLNPEATPATSCLSWSCPTRTRCCTPASRYRRDR